MYDGNMIISTNSQQLLVVVVALLLSPFASALSSFPEYWGFQEDEVNLIGRVDWVDSEYTSDALTFSIPPYWQSRFQGSNQAFDATIGSLGAKHFYLRRRLKVRQALAKKYNFQITYFEHSDFDFHQSHIIPEFDFFWDRNWGVAVYTELYYQKSRDDLGGALLYHTDGGQKFRLFYTATDFSRNERNEGTDSFAKAPLSYGLSSRWNSSREADLSFFHYGFRIEPEMQRDDPAKSSIYTMERSSIWYQIMLGTETNYDFFEVEGTQAKESTNGNVKEFAKVQAEYKRQRALIGCIWNRPCRAFWGLRYNQRDWKIGNEDVEHQDWLPHGGVQWLKPDHSIIELSFDVVYHHGEGPDNLRASTDENSALHSRTNFAYEWLFPGGSLKLYFTADLDRFSWEGGNGQFQLLF